MFYCISLSGRASNYLVRPAKSNASNWRATNSLTSFESPAIAGGEDSLSLATALCYGCIALFQDRSSHATEDHPLALPAWIKANQLKRQIDAFLIADDAS